MDATHTLLADSIQAEALPQAAPAPIPEDDLRPARGVVAGMVLGGSLWLILLAVGWLIFR